MKIISVLIRNLADNMAENKVKISGVITQKDRDYLEIVCKKLSCTLQELTDALMHKSVIEEIHQELEKVRNS